MKPRLAAAALAAAILAAWFSRPGGPVEVEIPPGSTTAQAASLLKERGVIRSAWLLRATARAYGIERKLKPGVYRLRAHMPLWKLIPLLGSGSPEDRILIPEGFAERLVKNFQPHVALLVARKGLRRANTERLG